MRSRSLLSAVAAGALVAQALSVAPGSAARTPRRYKPGPVAIAIEWVKDHRARYALSREDVSDLTWTDFYESRHNGVTHVYLRQRIDGVEVAGANMTVNLTANGRVVHAASRFIKDLRDDAAGAVNLDPTQAVAGAAEHLGLTPSGLRVLRGPEGVAQTTLLSKGAVSTLPIPVKLVYQPLEDGPIRLAWNLEIAERSGHDWWNISVDAETGEILAKFSYVDHEPLDAIAAAVTRPDGTPAWSGAAPILPRNRAQDGSSYRVFPLPLESPNDGKRALVKNPADKLASPFGWHDTDGKKGADTTRTYGNNAHAYADYTGPGNVFIPRMDSEGGEGLDFDFDLDFETPPQLYRDAAVTNLFYWNNVTHDLAYRYGFDEEAGNFQIHNLDRGGRAGDPVHAQAQDSGGVNNANFATPLDGRSPRMQMYLWPTTDGHLIDGDFDGGVIIHEYGHGISNRLTGGPNTGGCLSSHDEREGEGWSDFLAIAFTARKGDKGSDPRGMGTYVLNEDGRKDQGIRPTPYSTDKGVDPATYNSIRGAAEPHGVGYVWATMLWEVYWALVDKHGFNPNPYDSWRTGGNNLAIQLVMDGMKFQQCTPGFVDARDAILAADVALTGGNNQCEIWAAFAKRGLGYRARQGDHASKIDGTESYATHPRCK